MRQLGKAPGRHPPERRLGVKARNSVEARKTGLEDARTPAQWLGSCGVQWKRRVAVETAGLADLDALVAVETRAFDPALYTQMTRRQFRHHIESDTAVFLLWRDTSGTAVGYALGFAKSNMGYLRLYSLAVDPAYQGGRVGADLFVAFESAARQQGLRGVQLEIREDNHRLHERYLRLGYKAYRSVPDYYPDGAGCIKLKHDFQAA
jgi:[ribosomal protein S18]-alanine N-acetyltransferase